MAVRFLPVNYVKQVSDYIDCLKLVANVAQKFTVPNGYGGVFLSNDTAGVTVWATHTLAGEASVAAVIPIASISDGSCPMCNPAGLFVSAGDEISCISSTACIVTAEYYA